MFANYTGTYGRDTCRPYHPMSLSVFHGAGTAISISVTEAAAELSVCNANDSHTVTDTALAETETMLFGSG